MGYACPVCTDPQADSGHLANHLAFSAILGDEDHEAWLDEHAPGWNEMSEDELASVLAENVETIDFPQLFEDTVGGLESGGESGDPPTERSGVLFEEEGHGHDHVHPRDGGGRSGTAEPTDEETERILEKARAMTRRMHDEEEPSE